MAPLALKEAAAEMSVLMAYVRGLAVTMRLIPMLQRIAVVCALETALPARL